MISPVIYAKQTREFLQQNVSAEWADTVLNREDVDFVLHTLDPIPKCIPAKFHARMYQALMSAYLRVLFEQATYKYSLAERHARIQQVFDRLPAVRER